jgi:hypothetical protein
MDAAVAALLGAIIGSGGTMLGQFVSHFGNNRREKGERQYQELRQTYLRAYRALRLAQRVALQCDPSELAHSDAPFMVLDDCAASIELHGNSRMEQDLTLAIPLMVDVIEARRRDPNGVEYKEARQDLNRHIKKIRDMMRDDLALPKDRTWSLLND